MDVDLSELSLDASIVQAHQHCASAKKGASNRNWTQPRRREAIEDAGLDPDDYDFD